MDGWIEQTMRAAGMSALALGVSIGSANALVITPTFDSSITSLSNAAVVEQAFDIAVDAYETAFATSATIHVDVSWGKVNGGALPSGALGASVDSLYGYFTYAQVRSWLPSSDVLPASPASPNKYVVPSAEAKALGLQSANSAGYDGYIGFGLAGSNYSFTSGATKAGTYNFIAVAEHELDEVLGRISGIGDGFAAPFDLFRYTRSNASEVSPNFSASTAAYFSTTGGATQDGPSFNNARSGDRSDWYSTPASTDIQDAVLYPAITPHLSQADLDGLGVLGFRPSASQPAQQWVARRGTASFALVPEPASIVLFGVGLAALRPCTVRRRRNAA